MALPITFLSDYGVEDEFAGVCRAVIARIAPEARVIDLAHGIRPQAVAEGAAVLAAALPYAPPGVHLAVVDPGVGSERRGVAVRVAQEERLLVGPDNGLLAPAIARLGGAVEAIDVTRSPVRLEPVSATFHGRDVFAPVAAHLALGTSLHDAGSRLDPRELAEPVLSAPRIAGGAVSAHVVLVDRFGNASLDVPGRRLPETALRMGEPVLVEAGGGSERAVLARTFGDAGAGELVVLVDSLGALAVAVNRGSAAERLRLAPGDPVVLRAP